MERVLCKTQYVNIAKAPLNLQLNNGRCDVFDQSNSPACCSFVQNTYQFKKYGKCTLIDTLTDTNNR